MGQCQNLRKNKEAIDHHEDQVLTEVLQAIIEIKEDKNHETKTLPSHSRYSVEKYANR
jgi:hypothetical protein